MKGREGKIITVYRKKWVIHIERLTREKVNGEYWEVGMETGPAGHAWGMGVNAILQSISVGCSSLTIPSYFSCLRCHRPGWRRPFQGRHH